MYKKINLLLPTRKRVRSGSLSRYLKSAMQTADPRRLVVTFLADRDDEETLRYLEKGEHIRCPYEVLINEEIRKPHLGRFYNRLYRETRWQEEEIAVSMTGDDMIFETPGWDLRVLEEMNRTQGWAVVYGDDDLWQHEKMCVNLFTSRRLVEATGRPFMCEYFAGDFLDAVWHEVGRQMRFLSYLNDVVIRHENNYAKPKALRDETNRRLQGVTDRPRTAVPRVKRYAMECVRELKNRGVRPRMRLVHVLGSLVRGGAERVTLELARRFRQKGCDVSVVAVNGDGDMQDSFMRCGIPLKILYPARPVNLRNLKGVRILPRLAQILRGVSPDLLLLHGYHVGVWGAFAAWAAGIRRVIEIRHDCGLMRDSAKFPGWIESLSRSRVLRFVAVSRAVRKTLASEGVSPDRIEVIPNGVELPKIPVVNSPAIRDNLGIPEPAVVAGLMANAFDYKNYEMLIRAAARVCRKKPDAFFLAAGRFPDERRRAELENFARNLGVNGRFFFLGPYQDPSEVVPALDIGVLCSRTEGLGSAVLEYMAWAKPVVATRVGGVPEAVEENETGLLVGDDDDEGLALALLGLMEDPNRRRQMGEAGRRRVREMFLWEDILGRWQDLFQSLMAEEFL